MEALSFCIVSVMVVIYAVLEGFDLGAGIVHFLVSPGESGRRNLLSAVGGFWKSNEIWLLLAGGALHDAFPARFASKEFNFAAVVLVWMLILKGVINQLHPRIESSRGRWVLDIVFGMTSILLAGSLGVAIGSLVHNVPPAEGFRTLSWYTVGSGACGVAVATLQGAARLALKSTGRIQQRCRRLAAAAWWLVLVCYGALTAASLTAQTHILENLLMHSSIALFAILTLAGFIGMRLCLTIGFDLGAFAGASCVIAGLLGGVAAGQFPYLMPAAATTADVLTIFNAGAGQFASGQRLLVDYPRLRSRDRIQHGEVPR